MSQTDCSLPNALLNVRGDNEHADKKKIADGFNKFFTGAVQGLRQEFGQIKDSVVNQSEPRVSGNKSYPEFKFQLDANENGHFRDHFHSVPQYNWTSGHNLAQY